MLSYVQWDQPHVLAALRQTPVRVKLIMGDADSTLGQGWLTALQHIRVPMVVVHGAGHFLDGEHEFDLLNYTLQFLETIPQGTPR